MLDIDKEFTKITDDSQKRMEKIIGECQEEIAKIVDEHQKKINKTLLICAGGFIFAITNAYIVCHFILKF